MLEWFQTIGVILAAGAALYGVNTWRRQLLGGKRVELAEKLLASFYEARDVIRAARGPLSHGGEGTTRPKVQGETEDSAPHLNSYWVPAERLFARNEFFAALDALQYRAMAYFGPEVAQPFLTLRQAHNDVILACRELVDESASGNLDKDDRRKWTNTIWSLRSDDPLGSRVEEAVLALERICKPTLLSADADFSQKWMVRTKSWCSKQWRKIDKVSEGG